MKNVSDVGSNELRPEWRLICTWHRLEWKISDGVVGVLHAGKVYEPSCNLVGGTVVTS